MMGAWVNYLESHSPSYPLIESFVMGKRKQHDLDLDPIFDKIFAAANASDDRNAIVKFLKATKIQLESGPDKVAAKSITLEDAVGYYFSLKYSSKYPDASQFYWNIDTLPEVKVMQPSTCLCNVFPDPIDRH